MASCAAFRSTAVKKATECYAAIRLLAKIVSGRAEGGPPGLLAKVTAGALGFGEERGELCALRANFAEVTKPKLEAERGALRATARKDRATEQAWDPFTNFV